MRYFLSIAILAVLAACVSAAEPALIEHNRIWDKAPHNAFTDLIRFNDQWFCVFREGQKHVSPDGALRVITSVDGTDWKSAALLTMEDADLRDAKISITPEGKLMLLGAGAMHDRTKQTHQSFVWFSDDGRNWSDAHAVGDPDFWLWRVAWHKKTAYGFGYATGSGDRSVRLYRSTDGRSFDTLVENAFDEGYPNETGLTFLPDDTAYSLLRRDSTPNTAQLGVSHPPYTDWKWHDLGQRIGGPDMLRLPDGRLIVAGRRYDDGVRTSLHWLDPVTAKLTEFLKLPSGGDTSYAGMVWHDDRLWVSYYSSHEGKTSIYLAKVALPDN